MAPLTILVSACGAPGTAALLRNLKENGEREVRLVGSDMGERPVGRFRCDAFRRVPPGASPGFADAMLQLCLDERVDVVLPQSSHDILGLSLAKARFEERGIRVLVSPPDAIRRSNDKADCYALFDEIGVRGPAWRRVQGSVQLEAAARELGYPDVPVCFKPVYSSGSRGFRILDPTVDRAHQLLYERPGSLAMRLEEVLPLLPEEGGEELLVMEVATGLERTVDGFAEGGEIVLGHPKTREAVRAGLAMFFETLADEPLMETARKVVRALGIEHFFNIQLVGDVLIEVNPRISTIVYQEDLNLPWLGVRRALGELTDDEVAAARARIRPGRKALRFFDQVEFD